MFNLILTADNSALQISRIVLKILLHKLILSYRNVTSVNINLWRFILEECLPFDEIINADDDKAFCFALKALRRLKIEPFREEELIYKLSITDKIK